MKHLKTVFSILVVIWAVFFRSDDPDKSTTFETVTIEYTSDVPDCVANGVAQGLHEFGAGEGNPITFQLTNEKGDYRVHVRYKACKLSEGFRNSVSLHLRSWMEGYSPDKPIYMQVVHDTLGTLDVLKPTKPSDELCFHNGNYLFHSDNITRSEAVEMAETLERMGYATEEGGCAARVVRTDDQYELYLCYKDDEVTLHAARLAQLNLLANAKVTVTPCELDLNPIPDGTVHNLEGFRPGETSLDIVDNVYIVHDDSVSKEEAIAIATRLQFVEGIEVFNLIVEGIEVFTLTGHGNNYELRAPCSPENAVDGQDWIGFVAGEAFSELETAKTLRGVLFDTVNKSELFSHTVTHGHGAVARFHDNRLYYPKGTAPSLIDDLQRDLQSVGMFHEESGYLIRLHDDSSNGEYTVQIVAPAEESEWPEVRSYLQEIGAEFGKIAFPGRSFTLEAANLNFERLGDCVWHKNVDADEGTFAAEEEPNNATASL